MKKEICFEHKVNYSLSAEEPGVKYDYWVDVEFSDDTSECLSTQFDTLEEAQKDFNLAKHRRVTLSRCPEDGDPFCEGDLEIIEMKFATSGGI